MHGGISLAIPLDGPRAWRIVVATHRNQAFPFCTLEDLDTHKLVVGQWQAGGGMKVVYPDAYATGRAILPMLP